MSEDMSNDMFEIKWIDGGKEPQNPPSPFYLDGIDIDVSDGASETCATMLDHPAKRCGYYFVRCLSCGRTAAITTAGRVDDPRSAKMACRRVTGAAV